MFFVTEMDISGVLLDC